MIGVLYDPRKSTTKFVDSVVSIDLELTVDESHEWSNEITSNPVELGAPITDHIQPNPDKLSINGMITNAPLSASTVETFSSIDELGFSTRLQTHFDFLYEMKERRQLLTVYTRYKTYSDMAIKSISIPRNASIGEALSFNIEFQKIRLVSSQTVDIPPGISKKSEAKADDATKKKTEPQKKQGKVDGKKTTAQLEKEVPKFESIIKGIGGGVSR